jgi:toxin ParE1/3/4
VNRVIRPRVRDDIIRQYRWYLVNQDSPDAALRFVNAFEATMAPLLRMPNMGATREFKNRALKGLRVFPVNEFDEFLIFYLVQGDTLRVIRVLHGRRDVGRILKKEPKEDDVLN